MSAQDNAELARRMYEAFNNDEFERILPHVSDDVDVQFCSQGLSFHGREGFKEMMSNHRAPWPDGRVEVVRQLKGGDGVTNECVYRATHTAPMRLLNGSELAPTGRIIEIRFCDVWRFHDDKVISLHNYADGLDLMHQLGVVPDSQSVDRVLEE